MKIEFLADALENHRPLIRLYDYSEEQLSVLVASIRNLLSAPSSTLNFHELQDTIPEHGIRLVGMVTEKQQEIVQVSPAQFEWRLRPIDWQDIIEKIQTLSPVSKGEFQWLTDHSKIEVVASKDGKW